jgi:hypothetical protein
LRTIRAIPADLHTGSGRHPISGEVVIMPIFIRSCVKYFTDPTERDASVWPSDGKVSIAAGNTR